MVDKLQVLPESNSKMIFEKIKSIIDQILRENFVQ